MCSLIFYAVLTISLIAIKGESINKQLEKVQVNCFLMQDNHTIYSLLPLSKPGSKYILIFYII